jgi:altronate hydrolase
MFGAEQILMNRAIDKDVFDKIVLLINDFKRYFAAYGEPIYENPSPGNKDGGISTLEDKSLGCTQKSGTTAIVDVLKYGEKIKKRGLHLLEAPGNDLVASSALASSGCHMVLFTTGRGTPFGTYVPTLKVATNHELYRNKKNWLDFDAGSILDTAFDTVLNHFIDKVIAVASGMPTRNEENQAIELAIFKNGVTL